MKTRILSLILLSGILISCGTIGEQLTGAYNMVQCKYDYKSISNLNLSGMNLSNGVSPLNVPKIISILGGKEKSIPLNFTLNLDVNNPNSSAALLHGLQYIVNIDGIQFTTGSLNQSLNIPSGETKVLPLDIGLDLAALMIGDSKNSVVEIAKNFIGIGDKKSNVTVQLKPTFMVAGQQITSPQYIPVSFSFGGK